MVTLGRYAPWFHSTSAGEPLTYRAWKWLLQRRPSVRASSDLFNRIEQTPWDLLIILDACRYDILSEIADCAVIDRAVSPVSATPGFLTASAEDNLFDDAVYVSANPQTTKHNPVPHGTLIDVSESGWRDNIATVPPAAVYDAAFDYLEHNQRAVAHTLQPHFPHVCEIGSEVIAVPGGFHPNEMDVGIAGDLKMQQALASGKTSIETAARSYTIATKFAWDNAVAAAIKATGMDLTVVITADHGELFGEWGLVEHPVGVDVKRLTEVPWVVLRPTNNDSGQEKPAVADRLAALGYAD